MKNMVAFNTLLTKKGLALAFLVLLTGANARAQNSSAPKPVPRLQVIPMPYHQASFQRDGVEIARYHFGPELNRPFVFPVVGPSGQSLTRMGHPHDPQSHSHHNSVWISHNDVNGIDFWSDGGKGKIRHKRIVKYEDLGECSFVIAENEWVTAEGKILFSETRQTTVQLLEDSEWLLIIDMELKANGSAVTLGKTPFGMIGVRMAKTIGVNDGGGTIRNSEGGVNEKDIFWKRAKWVDYSGPVTNQKMEGITLFDHPDNPNFPSYFHVRNDGWMGASLTFDAPRTIEPDKLLHLRYGLYVHSDMKDKDAIEAKWMQFTKIRPANPENLPKNK
ncbi:MAG: PmoA family protein [Planctomycetota bacterium]|nr:PmoA family protein [Planctomycetota bacterium]